jgi:hypothetical protein
VNLFPGLIFVAAAFILLACSFNADGGDNNGRRYSRILPVFLAAGFGFGLYSYLTAGHIPGGDGYTHVTRTWFFLRAVHAGEYPFWVNQWYMGYPAGLFYGFLHYILSGVWALILPFGFFASVKLFLWLTHVLSGIFMFLLARRLFDNTGAAVVAGTVYAFSAQHLHSIVDDGYLPLSLVFILLPLVFMVFESFLQGRIGALKSAALSSLLLSACVLTHIQYGLYAIVLWILWSVLSITTARGGRKNPFGCVLLTGFLVALLTAWFLVPSLLEYKWLILAAQSPLDSLIRVKGLGIETVMERLWLILYPRFLSDPSTLHALYRPAQHYFGIVPFVIVLEGFILTWFGRTSGDRRIPYLLFAGFPMILLMPRFTNFWFFVVCLAAGLGTASITHALKKRFGWKESWVAVLLLLLVVMDLGPGLIKSPYFRQSGDEEETRTSRIVQSWHDNRTLALSPDARVLGDIRIEAGGASYVTGGIPQCAPRSHQHAAAMIMKASSEVCTQRKPLSRDTADGLRLMGVGKVDVSCVYGGDWIRLDSALSVFSRKAEEAGDALSLRGTETWRSLWHGYNNQTLDTETSLRIVREMEMDARQPLANRILLKEAPDKRVNINEGPTMFRVLSQKFSQSSLAVQYESIADGYLRLAYSYFPPNRVLIDGQRVPMMESAMGCTVVKVPAGRHTVEIKPGFSSLRKILSVPALLMLVLFAALALRTQTAKFTTSRRRDQEKAV